MYKQHSPHVFQRYSKEDTKVWFSAVRSLYSHSLLHNIISNRTGVNAHFFIALKIIPQSSVIISENKKETFCF